MRASRLAMHLAILCASLPAYGRLGAQRQPWLPPGQAGITFCRHDTAESWIRADVASSDEARAVLAHEAVHRAQAANAGSCTAFFASINTPERYVKVEAEAYCAQLRVLETAGRNGEELRDDYVRRIAEAGAATVRFVERRFDEICPRLPTTAAAR
jgi:hypothetical protein